MSRRCFIAIMVGLLSLACLPAAGQKTEGKGQAGTFANEQIMIDNKARQFRLVVPKSVDLQKPASLVFAFHGMGIDSKDLMPKYAKLDDLAAEKRFILVYPQRDSGSWGLAPDKVKEDLAFFDALLEHLKKAYKIDANRIYVLGMSNGGYFAQVVAVDRSKIIAAACSHSSPLGLQTIAGIKAERKFPVMLVHGDQDKLLPVEWTRDSRDKYKKEGHEVKYVEVAGLGHTWATGEKINEQIWEFFEKHPLK